MLQYIMARKTKHIGVLIPKKLKIITLILIVTFLAVILSKYIENIINSEKVTPGVSVSPAPSILPKILEENKHESNWVSYHNAVYGFQFKYPNKLIAIVPNGFSNTIKYAKGTLEDGDTLFLIEKNSINNTNVTPNQQLRVFLRPFSGTLEELLYIDNIGGNHWWGKKPSDDYYSKESYLINDIPFIKVKIVNAKYNYSQDVAYFFSSENYGLIFMMNYYDIDPKYVDQNDALENELSQIVSTFRTLK